MDTGAEKLKVLFLCTGNSCRSQMAEGWTRHLKGDVIAAYSAGVEPHGMNLRAVKVMAEAAVDISGQASKHIDTLQGIEFDYVITLCDQANESCPFFPGKTRRLHKGLTIHPSWRPAVPPKKRPCSITASSRRNQGICGKTS